LNPPPDEQRFLELIDGNRPRILKVCRVYAWNAADRDDLYQEVLFQIWRALPGLKQDTHANTWLYRIATNLAVNNARDTKHDRPEEKSSLDEVNEETGQSMDVADSRLNVEQTILRRERLKKRMHAALTRK
jgi:RNA polymerase sigma-70 factor (ECF subfamily)